MPFLLKSAFYGCAILAALFPPAASLPQPSSQDVKGVSLSLSLKGPASVHSVSDLIITGTLKNEGTRDILVIKDPSGLLYDFFTADALDFEKGDSKAKDAINQPTFVGYRAKWDMKTYLQIDEENTDLHDAHKGVASSRAWDKSSTRRGNSDDSSDESTSLPDTESSVEGSSETGDRKYPPGSTLALPAGKTISFNYKVGTAYDFSESGAGTYTFKPKRDFFHVLVDDVDVEVPVNMKGLNTVNIQGKLHAEVPEPTKYTRDMDYGDDVHGTEPTGRSIIARVGTRNTSVTTQGCDETQISIIDLAAQGANKYAAESNDYISAMTGSTPRYEHWFGKWDTVQSPHYTFRPRDQVAAMYRSLSEHSFLDPGDAGGYTYDCSCNENIIAFVKGRKDLLPPDSNNPAIINLCNGFRRESRPLVGTNSKAGVLIHEATHITYHVPPTSDYRYFKKRCEKLASDNPSLAAINSDSYEYFSENEPFET